MKLIKVSNYSPRVDKEAYLGDIDSDIKNIMLFSEGRVRFGTATTGFRGENIAGEFRSFTTVTTNGAETVIAHSLGVVPQGYLVVSQGLPGTLYYSGTSWTTSNVYLRSTTTTTSYVIFLLK